MDDDTIRELARTIRAQGTTLRTEADAMLDRAEAVAWQGLAAEAMRTQVRTRCATLHGTAALADLAGAALEAHADAVGRRAPLLGLLP